MIVFEDFRHAIPVQIRFSDIDRLDHVNNACYLNYFELGRVKYFKEVFRDSINWSDKGFVLARTEIDHLEAVKLNDEIWCLTKVIRIGNKSLTVKNSIVRKEKDQLTECAKGIGVLVAMDYRKNESIELPSAWTDLIAAFEK